MDARDAVAWHVVHHREVAANHDRAVGLDGDGLHRQVGPGASVEEHVERAVRAKAREIVPADAVEGGEVAADGELAIRRGVDAVDRRVRSLPRIEAGIGSAIGVQPGQIVCRAAIERGERAAEDHTSIGLKCQRGDVVIRARAAAVGVVDGAAGRHARQPPARRAAHGGERAAEQHRAVNLHGHGINRAVHAGVERGVEAARGVQARDVGAIGAVDGGEVASDQYLSVGLHGDGAHRVVGAAAGVEGRIQIAIGREPRDADAGRAIQGGEGAADQDFVIRLHGHGIHRLVGARAGVEAGIHDAGGG